MVFSGSSLSPGKRCVRDPVVSSSAVPSLCVILWGWFVVTPQHFNKLVITDLKKKCNTNPPSAPQKAPVGSMQVGR